METTNDITATKSPYPRVRADKPTKNVATDCGRCGGSGIFHTFGTCFRCGGAGYDPTIRQWGYPVAWDDAEIEEWNAKREAKNDRARERVRVKKSKERAATWAANIERCPGLCVVDLDYKTNEDASWFPLLADIRFTAYDRILSDKQVAAFNKSYDREMTYRAEREVKDAERAEAKANTPGWENGRQMVVGVVGTRRLQESDYGSTWKIRLVTEDGRGLWVSEPSSITTEIGSEVEMNVTVTVSDDDHTFAFGKRPAKAKILNEVESNDDEDEYQYTQNNLDYNAEMERRDTLRSDDR